MKENLKQFKSKRMVSLFMLFMVFTVLFPTIVQAAQSIDKTNGDIRVVARPDSHPIPSVTRYLNNKYGTTAVPNTKIIPHINVQIYKDGEELRDYHEVTYYCPECKKYGSLIYDYTDGIIDLHNCTNDKNKTRTELAKQAADKVKSLCNDVLGQYGADIVELASLAIIFLLIMAALIAMISCCAILVL